MLLIAPKDLKDALAAVKPALASRGSAIEALKHVRLTRHDDGSVYMVTTNMETSVRRLLRATTTTSAEFDLLLRHADLEKVAKVNAKRDQIAIHLPPIGPAKANVRPRAMAESGTRKIELATGIMEDFPNVSFERGSIMLEANGDTFAAAINRACIWASKDQTRPHLEGVQFDLSTNDPLYVSTDSYRLGIEHAVVHDYVQREIDSCPVVPNRSLLVATRLMKKVEWVYLFAGTQMFPVQSGKPERPMHVLIEIGTGSADETTVQARTVDGRFPDWRQLVPDKFEYECDLPTVAARESFEAAKVFTTRNQPVRVVVNGRVHVKVEGNQFDDTPSFEETIEDSVNVLDQSQAEMEIGFNPDFAHDVMKAAGDCELVRMRAISPLRPALFEAGPLQVLLMPIRLNV